jgi:uncharacterized protein YutE (UPF0331/DUF86 family)
MTDPLRLATLIERIDTELALLRDVGRAAPDLATDELRIRAVKYSLVVAIEACIDIARHVIARRRLRRPVDYADSFTSLAEAGLIDDDLAARLRDMARFRNLLVHGYATVDDDRVAAIVTGDVDDVERFAPRMAGIGGAADDELL